MDLIQIKRYILKNFITGIFSTGLTSTISIISLPLIIQNIGLSNSGVISIVLIFSNFVGLLDFGLSKSLVYFQNKNEVGKHFKEVSAIYIMNISIFLIVLCCGILIYVFDINFIGQKIQIDNETRRLINHQVKAGLLVAPLEGG